MALHWIISQRKYAEEDKDEMDLVTLAAGTKVTRITLEDLKAKFDKEWEDYSDEEEDVEMDMDEEEQGHVDVDEDMADEMNIDPSEPFCDGIDLTRVEWDSDRMKALLAVDMTILEKQGERPKSDRLRWIDPDDGYETLFTKQDQLAEDLKEKLCLL